MRLAGYLLGLASLASAQSFMRESTGRPSAVPLQALKDVGFDQKLDGQLPLDLEFVDESGRAAKLAGYFGKRPVILAPVYYECPMLCSQILQGLVSALRAVQFNAGTDFDVIAVSFNPAETPAQAADYKKRYAARYNRPGTESGWHFLTGSEPNIKALTAAMGFRYTYDPASKQFAHASGILLATPQGRISGYLYGTEYAPRDLRLSLVVASQNRVGSPVDQLLLYCYHYDPATGKYTTTVMNVLRIAAGATVAALAAFLILMFRRERLRRADLMSNA